MQRAVEADEIYGGRPPPKLQARPRRRFPALAVVLFAAVGAAAILFFFNPAEYGFYPVCYFHAATGLNCAGCGGLRALHELLHGHILEAARLNLLLLLCLPFLAWMSVRLATAHWRRRPAASAIPSVWLWVLLGVALVFTVVRNLPIAAFLRLSP